MVQISTLHPLLEGVEVVQNGGGFGRGNLPSSKFTAEGGAITQ